MKKQAVEHLMTCSQHHIAMAKLHGKASKEATGPAAEFHKTASEVHTAQAEHCLEMCKSLSASDSIDTHDDSGGTDLKAAGSFGMLAAKDAADLNKLVPTAARNVMPEDVPAGVRLIGRHGGPPIDRGVDDSTDAIDRFAR